MRTIERSNLKYWDRWLFIGFVLVALVVYLSVAKMSFPQMPSSFGDKINHLIAYGVLMGWFGQLFPTWRARIAIAVMFVALGITMEFVQGATTYRYFEWLDACANTLGVLLGLFALAYGAGGILGWFEKRLLKSI